MTILLLAVAVIVLIVLRIPVAYSLLFPSLLYLWLLSPVPLNTAVQQMVQSVNGFVLLAVPIFILLGNLANNTGIGDIIFNAAQNVFGRIRGGLGYVNIFTSLGFSWMSGTSLSDVSVLGSVQVPQMLRRGYKPTFVAGITSASSLITPIMPPSVPAIILGVTAGLSIGGLFAAAIIPALLLVVVLCAWVYFATRKNEELRIASPGGRETLISVAKAAPVMGAPVIVLGGILGGFITPTEAAAVALAYLALLGVIVYRKLNLRVLALTLTQSTRTIGTLMILIAAASVFAWIITMEQVPQMLASFTQEYVDSPIVFMILVVVFLLIIGTVMEPGAAILIAVPVLTPIASAFAIPPLQFGVLCLFTILIGLFTPPVGLVLFVLESVTTLKMVEIVRGVIPFVLLFIGFALLLVFIPGLTLWLPGMIM